ncbi:hypothetical protein [Sessilibacter corallicola]|uniref:TnsA endonuclease N-terminal domain-containing protein n=1 Tax=Sessilibacter corallicola TaxID=2904075 RepID=A0ABQ0A8E2_9GAMM
MRIKRKQLNTHLKKLDIPKVGIAYILRNYDSFAPARKGNGLFGSVHETYASRKNGFTVNSESRHSEAPFLLQCELSPSVLIYFDQPEPIKISYMRRDRRVTHFATYDFLVIEKLDVYLVECKPYKKMLKLVEDQPYKYKKTSDGFTCPPASKAAEKLGLKFKIITDSDFSVSFTRNGLYLLNFIPQINEASGDDISLIQEVIRKNGNRLRMSDLNNSFTQTQIVAGILKQRLFFDIERDLLQYQDNCWIYADKTHLDAIRSAHIEHELIPVTDPIQLKDIPFLWWEGKEWQIVNSNEDSEPALHVRRQYRSVSLTRTELLELILDRELYIMNDPLDRASPNPIKVLCSATASQIEKARFRQLVVDGGSPITSSQRTIYRYKAKFSEAKEKYGDGFIGLIDQSDKKGNRQSRLLPQVEALLEKYFKLALKKSPGPLKFYFDQYVAESEEQTLPVCSMKTFYQRFNKFCPDPKRTLLQKGMRAAYGLGPQPLEISLDKSLPYHGDHVFQLAHIDHSPIEMQFISKLNGEPLQGTMQLSAMYDGYSRKIIAIYLTFEKPSYRNTMMLLRECYKRHGTLPLMIAFDRGSDFESEYVDRTLASLGIHKRRRPVGYSRHGANIERIFGISESEFIHLLEGNKQLQKLGRSLSSTHNPKKEAIWSPSDFAVAVHEYAYQLYPQTFRAGIADTPQHRFTQSLENFDSLPGVVPSSKADFFIRTLPNSRGKDGMNSLNKNQIKFNHLLYRLSKRVDGYNGQKTKVKVKYDPYDVRSIWAKVNNQWVELNTIDPLVRECYDKGIQYAHLEVHGRTRTQARAYRHGNSRPLAVYSNPHEREKAEFSIEQNQTDATDKQSIPTDFQIEIENIDTYSVAGEESIV